MTEAHSVKECLLLVLNEATPLASVLQCLVASFLNAATLFVADYGNNVIRTVNLRDLSVRTLGEGEQHNTVFNQPYSLEVDKDSNTLLVGEASCLRRVTPDGVVSTVCGNPTESGFREGSSTTARFNEISGSVIVGTNVFLSDSFNRVIRVISLDGTTPSRLFAGTRRERGLAEGTNAKFGSPNGMAADAAGTIFVADLLNHSIRKITPAGVVSTLTGCAEGHVDGPLKEAKFSSPTDVAFDHQGHLLVADSGNNCIRSLDLAAGVVSTLAGEVKLPCSLAVHPFTGDIFLGCCDHTVRCWSGGTLRTLCGARNQGGHKNGIGAEARFTLPCGVALM